MCTVDCPAGRGLAGVHGGPAARAVRVVVVVDVDAAFFPLEHELATRSSSATSIVTVERQTPTVGSVPGSLTHAYAGRRDRRRAGPAPRAAAVRRGDRARAVPPRIRVLHLRR